MKRTILTISGILVICLLSLGGEATVKDEVLQVIKSYEYSVNEPDRDQWLSIWALDYAELTILENDKPEKLGSDYIWQIAAWMEEAPKEKRQTWHTNEITMLGPDLAYTVSFRTEHNMPKERRKSRVSLLLRKTSDGWKIIHAHFSFVPRV